MRGAARKGGPYRDQRGSTCNGKHPGVRFARYVDDIVVHAATEGHAKVLLRDIGSRMGQVGLTLHPDKTQIVHCQDIRPWKRQRFQSRSFTFLGYTFAPRQVRLPDGRAFIGSPRR